MRVISDPHVIAALWACGGALVGALIVLILIQDWPKPPPPKDGDVPPIFPAF